MVAGDGGRQYGIKEGMDDDAMQFAEGKKVEIGREGRRAFMKKGSPGRA
jgi:hypothetical protein